MLPGLRVVDLSQHIAGAYCTKVMADAGADVVKVEPRSGDPLRRWSASHADPGDDDGALFKYLAASKRSVVGGAERALALAAEADLVVEDLGPGAVDVAAMRAANPSVVVVSISNFGLDGPWASLPATEFTMQAWCGSTASRGTPDRPPVQAGGRIGEWAAGVYGALSGLAARRLARATGRGEHVDVSTFEAMGMIFQPHYYIGARLGTAPMGGSSRSVEVPSIVPTADDYVGFCTVTGQQFQDFLVMIDRADLLLDEDLARSVNRFARRDEFLAIVREWTTARSTEEVIDQAVAMRVPVAPIGDGARVPTFEHFRQRGTFVRNPGGFVQPRPPYRLGTSEAPPLRPAPTMTERLAEDAPFAWAVPRDPIGEDEGDTGRLPLQGLRVIDFTAFWAGPAAAGMLAMLGADVVKVESVQRPDGMRFNSSNMGADRWWEFSGVYQLVNSGKRDVTVDLTRPAGIELIHRLLAGADVVIENFTPRVMDHFGLGWEAVREVNPRLLMVRMPAFGLTGPWRDRSGFAQNMEQVSGMASVTGYPDSPPIIPRGPCDPISGMHAVVALLSGLEARDRTGEGMLIEVPMVEAVLNVAAEVVVEHSAYGNLLLRDANRGPTAAPQGVYPCEGDEQWLALAIETDDHWKGLRNVLADMDWMQSADLETAAGRRAAHDLLDRELTAWSSTQDRDTAVAALLAEGVPAAAVTRQHDSVTNPQHEFRGFYEILEHPLVGTHPIIGAPFRYASKRDGWLRWPAPVLGQHNDEVLGAELGLTTAELDALRADAVIGDRPVGL